MHLNHVVHVFHLCLVVSLNVSTLIYFYYDTLQLPQRIVFRKKNILSSWKYLVGDIFTTHALLLSQLFGTAPTVWYFFVFHFIFPHVIASWSMLSFQYKAPQITDKSL